MRVDRRGATYSRESRPGWGASSFSGIPRNSSFLAVAITELSNDVDPRQHTGPQTSWRDGRAAFRTAAEADEPYSSRSRHRMDRLWPHGSARTTARTGEAHHPLGPRRRVILALLAGRPRHRLLF